MKEYLYYFGASREKTPFGVVLAGVTYPHKEYIVTRARSKVNVLEYVVSGAGFVQIEGKMRRVEAGEVYLLPQGSAHSYWADPDFPFEKIFLNVTGSFFQDLVASFGLSGKVFFDGEKVSEFFSRIPQILRSEKSEAEKQAELLGLLVTILSRFSLELGLIDHSEDAVTMKNYLDRNPDRAVSMKELADQIYRSPDYCLKLFKKEFSTTPYAYQLSAKMEKAKALLSDTNLSVGQIAADLGYGDLHYFSNLFYSKCGLRPLAYRKKQRRERK